MPVRVWPSRPFFDLVLIIYDFQTYFLYKKTSILRSIRAILFIFVKLDCLIEEYIVKYRFLLLAFGIVGTMLNAAQGGDAQGSLLVTTPEGQQVRVSISTAISGNAVIKSFEVPGYAHSAIKVTFSTKTGSVGYGEEMRVATPCPDVPVEYTDGQATEHAFKKGENHLESVNLFFASLAAQKAIEIAKKVALLQRKDSGKGKSETGTPPSEKRTTLV